MTTKGYKEVGKGYWWKVESFSDSDITYDVVYKKHIQQFTCTCPDYLFRSSQDIRYRCKHILFLRKQLAIEKINLVRQEVSKND